MSRTTHSIMDTKNCCITSSSTLQMPVLCSGHPYNFQGGSYGEVRLYHEFRYNNQGDTERDPGMRFTRFLYHKNNLPSLTSSSPPLPSHLVDSEMLVIAPTPHSNWTITACTLPRTSLRLTDKSRFRNP